MYIENPCFCHSFNIDGMAVYFRITNLQTFDIGETVEETLSKKNLNGILIHSIFIRFIDRR